MVCQYGSRDIYLEPGIIAYTDMNCT
jgi:hypothetical protein